MANTCVVDASRQHDHPKKSVKVKRQYTLKGVEAEAIDLMRSAASKDGMKIGSWVSQRLREAAENSLSSVATSSDSLTRRELARQQSPRPSASTRSMNDTEMLIEGLIERISQLEAELQEQARTQRIILTRLVSEN